MWAIIIDSPVSDRYVRPGMKGFFNADRTQIRVGDAWWTFSDDWLVAETDQFETTEIVIRKYGRKRQAEFECWRVNEPALRIKTTIDGNSDAEVRRKLITFFLTEP